MRRIVPLCFALTLLAACGNKGPLYLPKATPTPTPAAVPVQPAAVRGFVTDTKAFDAFIATHPTPDQFRAAYPDVQLVLPGMVTTMEFRTNNSRYSAELDKDGRIVGGKFM